MNTDWQPFFDQEKVKSYFPILWKKVKIAYATSTVYPAREDIFRAYLLCGYQNCRVVIIGQDPYHGPGQANGLCFSVNPRVAAPPSLVNIFKELHSDLGITRSSNDLSGWAAQGILMLNRVLTVQAGQAYSHDGLGWQDFTLSTVCYLNRKEKPVIYVLWGRKAQELIPYIDTGKHHIIASAHPSPLSASAFFGSRPFSAINQLLIAQDEKPIDFSL